MMGQFSVQKVDNGWVLHYYAEKNEADRISSVSKQEVFISKTLLLRRVKELIG